jgi:ABC-type multidrug transport system fused ATPase/permease subunit
MNLNINTGEKMAIVGDNGAGKTTIIKLLLRFYQPTKGIIRINGIDINTIKYEDYVKCMTAVFQDFNIFNFSVIENIVFDNPYAEEQIEKIAHELNLDQIIQDLPSGYDTELGRRFSQEGIELSGGQQQKLAIARALFKNSSLIILDEPTAMLSPTAEFEIYSNFSLLTGDKTTLYISHRMSSCRFCSRIAVMKMGVLVELGNHDELMLQKGEYNTLYTTQAEFYKLLNE